MNATTTAFGTLTDYTAGKPIRPATAAEWRQSAGATHSSPWNGVFDLDGRAVRVDGGPEAGVYREDIIALASEAGTAGDVKMARIAGTALGINGQSFDGEIDGAWGECVEVILDNRANTAGAAA